MSFDRVMDRVFAGASNQWNKDKIAYLRGLETRAKLGALEAYVDEGLTSANVFVEAQAANVFFHPANMASAIVRQDFSTDGLRHLCHATVWASYLPITTGTGVYKYVVLRVYSTLAALRREAKLIYAEGTHDDKVLQAEAAARDASLTTVTQEAGTSVRPVDVGYD